jgi:tetratricopeptide (TPR) repeat protein
MRNSLPHLILIAGLGLAVYANTFDVPLHYDDAMYITGKSFGSCPSIFDFNDYINPSGAYALQPAGGCFDQDYVVFKTRFVGYLSLLANYRLGGFNTLGYHIVNLLIHIANSLLVYLFVSLTFKTPMLGSSTLKRPVALFAGLLFVAHPAQTEAVTYISQRFVELCTTFYLLSIVAYAGSRLSVRGAPRYGLYALAFISAVLAMLTKEIAFTLPLAVLLFELIFFKASVRKRAVLLLPLMATMLIVPLAYMYEHLDNGGLGDALDRSTRLLKTETPRSVYLFTEFRVIATYIRLLMFPVGQNASYDYPLYRSFLDPPVFISFLFLVGVLGIGVYLLYRSRTNGILRLSAYGIFWFFLSLSVESSLIPLEETIVEYRLYLPSTGIFLSVAVLFISAGEAVVRRLPPARKALVATMAAAILVLSTAAHARNTVWKSSISLWEDVVSKSPENARGHNNLGLAYSSRGLTDRAIEHFEKALSLEPGYRGAYNNLGIAYRSKGLTDKAIECYKAELAIRPYEVRPHYNLGKVYKSKGMFDKAIEHYRKYLMVVPDSMGALFSMGAAYQSKGMTEKAAEHFRSVLSLAPYTSDAMKNTYLSESHYNLALINWLQGLTAEAIEHYKHSVSLKPDNVDAHNNLGFAYFSKGQLDRAIEHYKKALEFQPDYSLAHLNLGEAYFSRGRPDKAIEHYKAFLKIRPDYAEAHFNIALAYEAIGAADKAEEHSRVAEKLKRQK